MRKAGYSLYIVLAALLLAGFSAGFCLGRTSVPYSISVQTQRQASQAQAAVNSAASSKSGEKAAEPAAADKTEPGPVNINTASKEQLMTLPGIGDVLADRILAYRKTYGKFSAAEQLMDVEGIGEAKFAAIKDWVTVG